jgi:hypothetical protein
MGPQEGRRGLMSIHEMVTTARVRAIMTDPTDCAACGGPSRAERAARGAGT